MFMVFKKKQMIMTVLVLMLGIAGYLNYRYDTDPTADMVAVEEIDVSEPGIGETVMVSTQPEEQSTEGDFFAVQRLERDRTRAKICDELKKTLESEGISEELRAETEKKLSSILDYEEAEATAQNLLSAKGFSNTMVYITDESVTVNIKQSGLSRSDTAKIVDVVYELTKNNNIKIVEVE